MQHDEPTPGERAASLAGDLAALYAGPAPRAWRVDAIAGLGRVVTGLVLMGLGAWYDYHKLAPGPITLAVLVGYVLPPIVRAVRLHRAEAQWDMERRMHIMQLQQQITQLPQLEIVTRLAALTARGHRTTDVVEAARLIALEKAQVRVQRAVESVTDDTP